MLFFFFGIWNNGLIHGLPLNDLIAENKNASYRTIRSIPTIFLFLTNNSNNNIATTTITTNNEKTENSTVFSEKVLVGFTVTISIVITHWHCQITVTSSNCNRVTAQQQSIIAAAAAAAATADMIRHLYEYNLNNQIG